MSSPSADDRRWMSRAIGLAEQGLYSTPPNPAVGCVLVRWGQVVGEGFHARAGGAHAEIAALEDAGPAAEGATAYVTLEPCSHHGRTPPCVDSLIAARIARAVIAMRDPNPKVDGGGLRRLINAGISVSVGPLADEAAELNRGFVSRMQRNRPWVTLKLGASLDGRTALANGTSKWITGEAARADGHRWRARASALLTGIGTVLEDDPRLDVRLAPTSRQPLRVVVDSRLQTPAAARILDAPGEVLIYTAGHDASREAAWHARGVRLVALPGAQAKVDLGAMLADLAARGINELHVEAGHKLNGSLLRAGLVDELLVYLAPKLLGAGREMAAFGPLGTLAEALAFEFTQLDRVGADLRILARSPGSAGVLGDN